MGNISASAPKSAGVKAERKIVVEKASIVRKRSSTGSNSSRRQSSSAPQQQEQLSSQVEQLIVGRRPVGRSASSTRPSPSRKGSSASARSAAVTGRPSFSSRRPSKEWKAATGGSARAEVLAPSQRDIVRHCFESAHADIGRRVNLRLHEKRVDFREFVTSLGVEAWAESSVALTNMLEAAAAGVENCAEVTRVGAELGEFYAAIKSQGFNFKPDYWVTMADVMVVECVYLDHAQHSTTDVTEAWSQLLSMLFSSARDAYYAKLRLIRQNSRRPSIVRQQTSTIITEAVEQHRDIISKSDSKTPPRAHHLEEEPVINGVRKTSNKGGQMETTTVLIP